MQETKSDKLPARLTAFRMMEIYLRTSKLFSGLLLVFCAVIDVWLWTASRVNEAVNWTLIIVVLLISARVLLEISEHHRRRYQALTIADRRAFHGQLAKLASLQRLVALAQDNPVKISVKFVMTNLRELAPMLEALCTGLHNDILSDELSRAVHQADSQVNLAMLGVLLQHVYTAIMTVEYKQIYRDMDIVNEIVTVDWYRLLTYIPPMDSSGLIDAR